MAPRRAPRRRRKGTYYYRVAAVLDGSDPATQGEALPSDEIIASLSATGQIKITWSAPAVGSVAHYRVYRTVAADSASGAEVLLKDNVGATSYTDTGSDTPGTETPMPLGSTGPWLDAGVSLGHARLDLTATIGPDPNGARYLYVLGGWGQCAASPAAAMNCYELAPISADGATLGSFTDGTNALAKARLRAGSDVMTAENGPASFAANAGAETAFVVLGGGKNQNTSANTVEYARVTAGGQLTAWASPGGFATERDGTQVLLANGYGYALFGGNAPTYSQTADQSPLAVVTATTLAFGTGGNNNNSNWANAASSLAIKVGRHGVAAESAYFYVVGGTTNDADALSNVYQVLH